MARKRHAFRLVLPISEVKPPMRSIAYSTPRVLLHWIFALVIIWATVSGFGNAMLDLPDALSDGINFINVSLTAVLIPLFALRIYFTLAHPLAHAPDEDNQVLVKAGHLGLYVMTALVLVTGVLMMERPINVFSLALIPQPLAEPLLTGFFNTVHKACCVVLALLVVGHIGAVAVHHCNGHKLLQRMSLRRA